MKKITLILLSAALLVGCAKKVQDNTLSWFSGPDMWNYQLIIFTDNDIVTTNVTSLDQAVSILNQYGWKFVSADVEDGDQVYHMRREARTKCDFNLVPSSKSIQ
jgi:PBP1b-binding outer membrane lipoprotein LpoB